MRQVLLFLLLIALALHLPAQNIVLAGSVERADTMNITVWSKGKHILSTSSTEPVYAIILGAEPNYTIQFECKGQIKDALLITTGMKSETINLPVDFANQTSVIIWREKHGQIIGRKKYRNSDPISYTYYGFHAYRKQF